MNLVKEERHNLILETLLRHDSMQVSELAAQLNVSAVTIRKDLTELERASRLYRSHGKAILINPYVNNRTINEKEKLSRSEKDAIGLYASTLIDVDDSIIIASGTTVLAFARAIHPQHKLTVISASLQVSEVLSVNEDIDVVQLGGAVRTSSLSVVGNIAEAPLADFSCSKLFMGVDGIDLEFGLTTTDIQEASLNRAMMHAAQQTIVLADASKFRRRGFAKISNITDIDMIITDSSIPDKVARQIEETGVELKVVQTKEF